MSNRAIQWALAQSIKPSGAKFVLVVLADMVRDVECQGWPPLHAWGTSLPRLAELTAQDDKTVRANLQRLVAGGYIEEAGKAGRTGQVNVYRVLVGAYPAAADGGAERSPKATESGSLDGATKTTETGTLYRCQKATESGSLAGNERLPVSAAKTPVFHAKDSQFRPERLPKTGDETLLSPVEPKEEPRNTARVRAPTAKARTTDMTAAEFVAEGLSPATAAEFIEDRKRRKASLGRAAWSRQKNEAEKAGLTVEAATVYALGAGWQAFTADYYLNASGASGGRRSASRGHPTDAARDAANSASSSDAIRRLLKQDGLFGGSDAALPLVERIPEGD